MGRADLGSRLEDAVHGGVGVVAGGVELAGAEEGEFVEVGVPGAAVGLALGGGAGDEGGVEAVGARAAVAVDVPVGEQGAEAAGGVLAPAMGAIEVEGCFAGDEVGLHSVWGEAGCETGDGGVVVLDVFERGGGDDEVGRGELVVGDEGDVDLEEADAETADGS
jgi:hypothetical protein